MTASMLKSPRPTHERSVPINLRAQEFVSGAWLPTIVFLISYGATTAPGEVYFLTEQGQADLLDLLGDSFVSVRPFIGLGTYDAILFLPFVICPVFAYIGMKVIRILLGQPIGALPLLDGCLT
jgi:hypothetical protein